MSIESMNEHFKNSEKYYEQAKNAPNDVVKYNCLRQGDEEYKKGVADAEKMKTEISVNSCNEAKTYYDKCCEAQGKGDYKSAKEYMDKGDKIMADAKIKQKELEEQTNKATETRTRLDSSGHRRY